MRDMDTQEPGASVRTSYVRGLYAVLQAIKSSPKQTCSMTFASDGLTVRWEDESKTLQCSVFLKAEMFTQFICPPQRKIFGVQFNLLLDTLNVFASMSGSLDLAYPGPNGEITCEMVDESGEAGVGVVTYARISSVEQPQSKDLVDYWEDPSSYFLASGALLKEVLEDLEWAGGDVEVVMTRDPAALVMSSRGMGALEISLPMDQLSGFHCASPEVRFAYKYKNLKAAFCHIPSNPKEFGNVSTKVTIDRNGLLKATHIIGLQQGQGQGQGLNDMLPSASFADTQRINAARSATVTFVTVPALDERDT